MIKGKLKKGILITAISCFALFAIIIIFISPIAKYLIEKYDVKYLGREIKIGWLYLNPFTAYLHIGNLKLYEAESGSVFFSADGITVDFQLYKVLNKTYEINTLTIDKPVAYIIQNRKTFNFSDIINRITPQDVDTLLAKKPVRFNLLDIAIKDGEFHYIEQTIPVNYFVKKVNISSPGTWWDKDSINFKFALESGLSTGKISGDGAFRLDSLTYRLGAKIEHFDLGLINQYFQDLSNYGSLAAFLDADINAFGGVRDELDFDAKAFVSISDFHFGKDSLNDFASFDKLVIDAQKISPRKYQYYMDSIMIASPFFMFERYDELNNIEKMFGKGGSRIKQAQAENEAGKVNLIIEIAKFVEKIAKNFLESYYKINKVAVYNGDIRYNDFAVREKFSLSANPLNLIVDSADKNKKRFTAELKSDIKPYGKLSADISVDPNNYGNFNLRYKLLNIPVSLFNPFVVTYTSFPLDRGRLEFTGYMDVVDSTIKSENHLLIIDPRVAKRVKKKDTKWIPVPFIMSLVRSAGNAIDFQIPIAGSLSNPKFNIWKVVGEVVKNIIIKPPLTPYLYHVTQIENKVEKSLSIKWLMRQTELTNSQEKFIERISDFLRQNDKAQISISPMIYAEKEKENILFFQAKKKYFLSANKISGEILSEDDSIKVDKMSVKDTLFIKYLNKVVGDSMLFTVQEKCAVVVSESIVASQYSKLLKNREQVFKQYFGDMKDRVNFNTASATIPFNGFSYYRINYNGEFPDALKKAYNDLEEINDVAPREKYKERRTHKIKQLSKPEKNN